MYRFVVLLLLCLTTVCYSVTNEDGSENMMGPPLGFKFQIERNFALKKSYSPEELTSAVQHAILTANPTRVGLKGDNAVAELAGDVIDVAQCYRIDPIVFTALIWRESNFKLEAVSERGAVGLTQMTFTGVKEVLDRLNFSSNRRLNYLRGMVRRCDPDLYQRLPSKLTDHAVRGWKHAAAVDARHGLVFGALLLKLNLAGDIKIHASRAQKLQAYVLGLQHYNGDPHTKVQFAKDVLQLSRRLIDLPEIALNDSKFLSQIRGL